jgi:methylthioribose-1-phosphate isomerase
MPVENSIPRALSYDPANDTLRILNQLKLPYTTEWDSVYSSADAWHAIRDMRVRGAPAIALVAILGLSVELATLKLSSIAEEVGAFIEEKLDYLVTSRPTAVNLADAAKKVRDVVKKEVAREGADGESVRSVYKNEVMRLLEADVEDCTNIAKHGVDWLMENTQADEEGKRSLLTHCNTGYVCFYCYCGFSYCTKCLCERHNESISKIH